jgi:hypothetical protein
MKYLLLLLLSICGNSALVAQSKERLSGKFWYIKCDSIVEPNDIERTSFSSQEPQMPYCMWRFEADGNLGCGSRSHGDNGGTFVRLGNWKIKKDVLRIGSLKFKILALTDEHLLVERK